MSDGWNIALLGATGAVGRALLELLAERQFPVGNLYLLASERSAGETIRFEQKSLLVQDVSEFDWSAAQLAFFVAGYEASSRYAEEAASAGCLVIDSSHVFALEPDVPLVVPVVNPHMLAEYRNRNIISVADSLTSQLLCVLKPLVECAGLRRLQLTCLLSASLHGKAAVDSLAGESARLLNGLPAENHFFGRQLAFNLLPLMADQTGYVEREQQLVDQIRKVMQDEGLPVSVSIVQAPVFYGNAQVVHYEGLRPVSAEEAQEVLESSDLLMVARKGHYPTPVDDASNNGQLNVGCLRSDYGCPELLQFWSVADNIRVGGALMAILTAEKLIQEYFY